MRQSGKAGDSVLPSLLRQKPELIEGLDLPWPVVESWPADLVSVDPFTGSCQAEIPLRLASGTNGFGPDISLRYNSGWGSDVFGVGWRIEIPSIGRVVGSGVPRYDSDDVYEFGSDELVLALASHDGFADDTFEVGEYFVARYQRRIESQFDRLERWVHQPSGQTHWRSVDANNVTSLYGINDATRISDPDDSTRIVRWLLAEKFDDKGNVVRHVYKSEDLAGVPEGSPLRAKGQTRGPARYLKRILYANVAPHDRGPWHFEVVLDYGEHDDIDPTPRENHQWGLRPDAIIDSRPGFALTTMRRCRRILAFQRFPEFDAKVRHASSTELSYDDTGARSLLTKAKFTGFIDSEGDTQQSSLPALAFSYGSGAVQLKAAPLDSTHIAPALADEDLHARWTDFYQEGLPGVLFNRQGQWHYVRNLGNGTFGEPEVVPHEETLPVIDLRSEGITEEQLAHERSYQPLTTLRTSGNPSKDDQYIGYIDLNGDHADDVIVAADDVVRWYPSQGEDGFGDPVVMRLEPGDRVSPRRLGAESSQSFHIADMTGDGLYDLVRVRSGEVSYWPGRGRGRFGARVKMDAVPKFDEGALAQVILADVNGSGATDLVLVGSSQVTLWENYGGVLFSPPRHVDAPGLDPSSEVTAIDLWGRGADALVWLDASQETPTVRYLTHEGLFAGALLSEYDNGRGARCRLSYVSSADLWRRDRDQGREWLFSSPITTRVVERLEMRDDVSGLRRMQRYQFRNAAFDTQRRRLIGFATSEVASGGRAEDYAMRGLFADEEPFDVAPHRRQAPIVTKRWFHTGSMVDGEDLTLDLVEDFYTDEVAGRHRWLGGHRLPDGVGGREVYEAFRPLQGWLLREERYSDGTQTPYRVTESTAHVRCVQPRRSDRNASYHAIENERIQVDYDDSGRDPRIEHWFNAEFDHHGAPSRQVNVKYRRRNPESGAQEADLVTLTTREYLSRADASTWYRINVPGSQTSWSTKAPRRAKNQVFEPKDLAGLFTRPKKELVNAVRWRYWSNNCERILDYGELESRALLARTEELAFTDALLAEVFDDDDIEELLRYEGGYQRDELGWWAPGITYSYDPGRFFVVINERNALGHERSLVRRVAVGHAVTSVDGYGNEQRQDLHPRSLQWWRSVDVNKNVIDRRFDALGAVLSVADVGKLKRGPAGEEVASGDNLDESSLEASANDNPTAVQIYRLSAEDFDVVHIRHRIGAQNNPAQLFERVLGFSPFGQLISSASRCGAQRWCVEELVERNADGYIVRSATPFYSDRAVPDIDEREQRLAQGRRSSFDTQGRIIEEVTPDGAIWRWGHGPWAEVWHDSTDTVMDSDWYRRRQGSFQGRAGDFGSQKSSRFVFDARAAAQSVVHAQTPELRLLGTNGKLCAVRQSLSVNKSIETRHEFSLNQTAVVSFDGLDRPGRRKISDHMGRPLLVQSIDGGKSVSVYSASGQLLRSYGPQSHLLRYRYDGQGCLTHVFESAELEDERLVQRLVWAGGETEVVDAVQNNLVGRCALTLDSGGLEVLAQCDQRGRATKAMYYPTQAQVADPDWASVGELSHDGQMLERLRGSDNPPLRPEPMIAYFMYDALGRLARMAAPDRTKYRFTYGTQTDVESIDVNGAAGVSNLAAETRYLPAGALTATNLAGGSRTRRRHDPMGRPVEIVTSLPGRERQVQDQQIVYDVAGNVTCVSDGGELVATYTYDSLHRLVRAEGFEPAGNGVRRYSNSYELDEATNVRSVHHSATGVEWTRQFSYEDGTNHLRASSRPTPSHQSMAAAYDYDAAGNMVSGANREQLRWDGLGRLVGATAAGVSVIYGYNGVDLVRRLALGSDDSVQEIILWGPFQSLTHRQSGQITLERHHTVVGVGDVGLMAVSQDPDGELEVRLRLVDHMGSVLGEFLADGTPVTEEEFTAFGLPWLRRSRTDEDLAMKTAGFAGGLLDTTVALMHCHGRWYSPWLGRYVDSGGSALNPYALNADCRSASRGSKS